MATQFSKWTGSLVEFTAGLEVELFVTRGGLLVAEALRLIHWIWSNPRYAQLRHVITPEYYACMIELKTPGEGLAPAELPATFSELLALLIEAAADCGLKLLPAAHRHGSDKMWHNQPLFENPDPNGLFHEFGQRYRGLNHRLPQIRREPRIPGGVSMQPHAGLLMATPEQKQVAIMVCDMLTTLVPALAAIGANSPDPGNPEVDSMRLGNWLQLPRAGMRLFHSFDELEAHAADLIARGEINDPTELWYVVRLNQQTVEVRCIDMQPTADRLLSMQAFVHCLAMAACHYVRNGWEFNLPPVYELNDIDLSRVSLQRPGQVPFWDFELGRWTTLDDRLEWLLEFARSGVGNSGQGALLNHFEHWVLARNNGAAMMRQLYTAHPAPESAYQAAADIFAGSVELARVA